MGVTDFLLERRCWLLESLLPLERLGSKRSFASGTFKRGLWQTNCVIETFFNNPKTNFISVMTYFSCKTRSSTASKSPAIMQIN